MLNSTTNAYTLKRETYNTDYVLIKKENYQKALDILQTTGYKIVD